MLIRDKVVYVYDIEVFPNVFSCTLKNTESGEVIVYEISNRKNDISKLINMFYCLDGDVSWNNNYNTTTLKTDRIFCGYNVLHYDSVILNYIINYKGLMESMPYEKICKSLFNLSNSIITSKDDDFNAPYKKWQYLLYFESLDLLTMLFSNKLRVSLKAMQVTMGYKNVEEYSGDFTNNLPDSEIDKMLSYNLNDVLSTEELLNRCRKDIDLRLSIEDEYGVKVLNKDGVNIGMKIITKKYLEATGKSWKDIKDLRSPCDRIDLSKVILPFIKYDSKKLQDILSDMKRQVVTPDRKGYEKHFLLDNLEYSVGVGGRMCAS